MGRYIDIDKMNKWTEVDHESCSRDNCASCDYDCNECYYNNGGAEDVVKVIRSEWFKSNSDFICTNCGIHSKDYHNFCPNCGAKMNRSV